MRSSLAVVAAVAVLAAFATSPAVASSLDEPAGEVPLVSYHGDCVDYVEGNATLVDCLRICFNGGSWCTI